MNRSHSRLRNRRTARLFPTARRMGAAVAGLIAVAGIAGCGTGQIAQTTDQASAVNGTEGVVGDVALRDVRMQAVQTGASLHPGSTVDLAFVASNQSLETSDELTGISSDIGKVSLTGTRTLPAGGSLLVSAPASPNSTEASPKELRAVEDATTATATVTLDKPISNGLTYEFTFAFKQAGPITLAVPISARGAAAHPVGATPRPHS